MRPPSRRLAPGAGTARPPPPGRQGLTPGDQRPPPTPPRPPPQAKERGEADRRDGGPAPPPKRPLHPGCGGTAAEASARTPSPLPADGGPAAPRTAQTERPLQRPVWERRGREPRRGGSPPLPPPPRRTDPLAADPAAPDACGRPATPTTGVYPGGARRRQRMAGRRLTGRGDGGRRGGPPNPPLLPPPSLRATGATSRPPGAEGTPPLPQKGPRRGEGDAAGPAHRATQRPQPPAPAGVAADRRAHTSAPERRADQAWGRRTAAHQNSMEAAQPMTPP